MYGNRYVAQQVETASPAQLVTMLYDGALAAIARARAQPDDPETVNRELQRAQAIVTELRVTLDFERGGELATRLSALYGWFLDQLVSANLAKDLDALEPVVQQLIAVRDAWETAATAAASPALAGRVAEGPA